MTIRNFPPGHPALGDILEVRDYNLSIWTGYLVAEIKAGEKPDPNKLNTFFEKQLAFKGLKAYAIPIRASKYHRYVVELYKGRCIVFSNDKWTTVRPGDPRNMTGGRTRK